ncbi:MAG: C_GCAxxG_C_C family protein, partial [Anaerolineae bacterium]|nr:C_GCAxxG_C_C family protein [Anaerolineae bacterium]
MSEQNQVIDGGTAAVPAQAARGNTLRSANNMLRMGHCAPSIMRTLLDIAGQDRDGLVLAAGGLAGGIAGSTMECGGVTAPLMFLSLHHNYTAPNGESLALIRTGRRYVEAFAAVHGSCTCEAVGAPGISGCLKAICGVHTPLAQAQNGQADDAPGDDPYARVLEVFADGHFHCAHGVLENLAGDVPVSPDLLRAAWIFVGGTACQNMTCGALTAGAIALSATNTTAENSYRRVLRLIWLLMHNDDDAMRDDRNHFNRSISRCAELGEWFRAEFGTTSCRELCGSDFSNAADVERYRTEDGIARCRGIAAGV